MSGKRNSSESNVASVDTRTFLIPKSRSSASYSRARSQLWQRAGDS